MLVDEGGGSAMAVLSTGGVASAATQVRSMPRLTALDGLRGVAALMVFVHHVRLPGLHPATTGLDAGVLIFFSLSGYLLYAPFVAARNGGRSIDITTYSVRRLLRIAPAYLVAAFAIAWLWYPDLLQDPVGLASSLHPSIVVVWTLQLEVAFYVLLPVMAAAIGRLGSVNRVRILLCVAATSLLFTAVVMVVSLQSVGFVSIEAVRSIASYLWAFAPGMIVAELEHRGALRRPLSPIVLAAGFALILLSVVSDPPPFFDLPSAIGASFLIAYLVSRPGIASRFDRLFVVAGALSYSFYLWHEAIIEAFDRPTPTWSGAVVSAFLALAAASIVYLLIERPAIRFSHRLRPRRQPSPKLDPVLPGA